MNKTLPRFDPPSRDFRREANFGDYLKQLDAWLDRYTNYVKNYLADATAVLNTNTQGFSIDNVASASTVQIGAYITQITGSSTVSTIQTSPGFSGQILLIANDGFSTDTLGNISLAITITAGQAAPFNFDPVSALWYPVVGTGIGPSTTGFLFGTSITQPGAYPYTVTSSDLLVMVDTSGGARTINLPAAVSRFAVYIKDQTGNGFVNNITIVPNGAEKIDNSGSLVLANNYDGIMLAGTGIVGDEWAAI